MSIIFDTPNGILAFHLIAAKHAIRLEELGMKHRKGSARKHWAILLGLPERAPHAEVVDAIQARIDAIRTAREEGGAS